LTVASPAEPENTLGDEIQEKETDATVLSKARRGQGRFRADLLHFWRGHCALIEGCRPELLRASHIKPWNVSTNHERLDTFNGLLLAVHLDALFDRALITFQDSGEMLVSQKLSDNERAVFSLTSPARKLLLSVAHLDYMRHHRERFGIGDQKH
jgi:putative restriction endonuclease